MKKPYLYIRLVSAAIALLYLYVLLPIRLIAVYSGSELKAVLVHALLFTFLYFSHTPAVSLFFHKDKVRAVALSLLSGLTALAVTFFISARELIEPALSETYGVRSDYLVVGDYLRDVHGLNIYFFDLSGWILTKYVLACVFIFAIVTRVIDWIFLRQNRK
jgi:hypothetical protein